LLELHGEPRLAEPACARERGLGQLTRAALVAGFAAAAKHDRVLGLRRRDERMRADALVRRERGVEVPNGVPQRSMSRRAGRGTARRIRRRGRPAPRR
jgi:hypothetical protein